MSISLLYVRHQYGQVRLRLLSHMYTRNYDPDHFYYLIIDCDLKSHII